MPGLPGSDPAHDLEMTRRLFEDPDFRPDGLKIYPTMVVSGTTLEGWWLAGRYQPYDDATMIDLVADIKAIVPPYVRISRVLRDIPVKFISAGLKDSLRGPVKARMHEKGTECHCIRCREFGHRRRDARPTGEPALKRLEYDASGGREIFLSFEDVHDTLYGLLRLRVQPEQIGTFAAHVVGPTAIVRELHVYGAEVPLRQQDDASAQHRGFGRALLKEAERIARVEFAAGRLYVLSGVGAREYYAESGYVPAGVYMVKDL
jgi:elongator complex protein 3